MIEIYGIIGISILKKHNKYYIIFYDDHTNINYCNKYIPKEVIKIPPIFVIFIGSPIYTTPIIVVTIIFSD